MEWPQIFPFRVLAGLGTMIIVGKDIGLNVDFTSVLESKAVKLFLLWAAAFSASKAHFPTSVVAFLIGLPIIALMPENSTLKQNTNENKPQVTPKGPTVLLARGKEFANANPVGESMVPVAREVEAYMPSLPHMPEHPFFSTEHLGEGLAPNVESKPPLFPILLDP